MEMIEYAVIAVLLVACITTAIAILYKKISYLKEEALILRRSIEKKNQEIDSSRADCLTLSKRIREIRDIATELP